MFAEQQVRGKRTQDNQTDRVPGVPETVWFGVLMMLRMVVIHLIFFKVIGDQRVRRLGSLQSSSLRRRLGHTVHHHLHHGLHHVHTLFHHVV